MKNHVYCAVCGKPLVGHCLNKKYRYYQCSSARPYENHGKTCNALYIRAFDLEELVWNKTLPVLSNPEIILNELTKAGDQTSAEALDAEIELTEKALRNYEQRRNNLLGAIELGEFDKDEILDRLNKIKHLRTEDAAKLSELKKTREHIASLADARLKLNDLYQRVLDNLENASFEIKALALDALDIKVYAKGTDVQIQGVIPLELGLPTTGQTSASLRERSCPFQPVL